MQKVELKKPTKSDMESVLNALANNQTVEAVYLNKYVKIVGASLEAVIIETYDKDGLRVKIPLKKESIKLVFEWNRSLRMRW